MLRGLASGQEVGSRNLGKPFCEVVQPGASGGRARAIKEHVEQTKCTHYICAKWVWKGEWDGSVV